jgi:hypothetical protein
VRGESENWRPIEGFPAYEVSDHGRVRRGLRVLRPFLDRGGYAWVGLISAGVRRKRQVHRIVAVAFHGEAPSGREFVNHRNSARADNRATNLEWVSRSENRLHGRRVGHVRDAHLTDEQARQVAARFTGRSGEQAALAREYGVSFDVIHRIVRGKTYKAAIKGGAASE